MERSRNIKAQAAPKCLGEGFHNYSEKFCFAKYLSGKKNQFQRPRNFLVKTLLHSVLNGEYIDFKMY